MQKYDDKTKIFKAERYHKSIFLVGVMILLGVFFSSFVSSTFNWTDNSLIGYWQLDETSGTDLADVLKLNNLTAEGGATVNQAGKIGKSVNLDGTNDYLNISGIVPIPTNGTWSFWVYIDTLKSNPFMSDRIKNPQFQIYGVDADGTLGIYSPTLTSSCNSGIGVISAGVWTHIAVVYNGTHLTQYVNGTKGKECASTGTIGDLGGNYTFGWDSATDYYDGKIDEIGIWNVSLSATNISDLWNSGDGLTYSITQAGLSTINVSLISPTNVTTINTNETNFAVNLSITGTNNSHSWVNNTYSIWFNNGTLANTTFVNGLSTNQTNFSRNIDNFIVGKSYLWNSYACYGNTTTSNCSWSLNGNWTFTYVPFSNTGESYSSSTYETKNETFYLNITTIPGASKMGAFLVYNGTFYAATHTCSGSNCQVWRKLDIPLMNTQSFSSENKSFYWQITVFGTFGTSTSITTTHNQNVSNLIFNNCVPGYNNSINFTIYNETDRNLLDATFKSKFNFWLGDGTVKDTYNFSGNGHNNYLFCINHNLSYITSSYITINATNSRIYQFVKEIYTNALKVQKLFIPDNLYSNIIIEVKNQGLVPQKDISVNISRYYPETDSYEIVENQVTDEYGQIIAKLIQSDAKYKFNFYDVNNKLLKTSDLVTVICRSSICVIPFVIETTSDYLGRYNNISLFDYSLEFDNATNIFTYSWDDQTGESSTHRLEVIRYSFNQSEVVCNVTSTTTVSSLTCNVGSSSASYTSQTFRAVSGKVEIRTSYLQTIVGDYSSTFGIEGLFWVFVLLMTCVGIGVYDPKVGAIVYGAGFIIMGMLKIIYMPVPVFFANTLLVILFVWSVRT